MSVRDSSPRASAANAIAFGGRPRAAAPEITASFTRDDQLHAQAYLANRMLLYQLWDLATVYPNIASRVLVRIRKADPKRDYLYDANSEFADSAIVVMLSWSDRREACAFLSCNESYPRGTRCKPGDEPRIFPSGGRTTLTACEPACFIVADATTKKGELLDSILLRGRYESTAARVMSPHTCLFETIRTNDNGDASAPGYYDRNETDGKNDAATARSASKRDLALDVPYAQFSSTSGKCELANLALISYVTKPYSRSVEEGKDKHVCRLTNFVIGDDLATSSLEIDGSTHEVITGRHSKTYCDGFYQEYNPENHTCSEPLWEKILSYTFVGSAIVRLARHAINGGDQCDTMLPTDPLRKEVDRNAVPRVLRSRRHWFDDVRATWLLPPP